MSGGVDSAVAALLLVEAGYTVEGLFMKNWDEDDGTEYCTAIADLEDAQRVCDTIGIPLHTANFAAEYWDGVFESFLAEYAQGRTPNPDVLCNREIKFKQFVDYAKVLDADYIATGHYARLVRHPVQNDKAQDDRGAVRWLLKKAHDTGKDQTYFLQAVPLEQFAKCLFPLGEHLKHHVRALAKHYGLHNHERKDSTGICFIGERRFADFIRQYLSDAPGPICDEQGRVIGAHKGVHAFTLGQRQGLHIGGVRGRREAPWFVLAKCQSRRILYVTQNPTLLLGRWLQADAFNWLVPPELPMRLNAKTRYRQDDQACVVGQAANGRILVKFDTPQRSIAPGQYVALYHDDVLVGGGKIQHCDGWIMPQAA